MIALWFACLALHLFSVSDAYPGRVKYLKSFAGNRYFFNEGECSPIHPEPNRLISFYYQYDNCAIWCDEFAECQSFNFNDETSLCQTYNTVCTKFTPSNFSYSFTKKQQTGPKVIFSSTYFLQMFGACGSDNSLLVNMSLSTTMADCANECAKYPQCQYAAFSNKSQPNCKIGGKFCDISTDRIYRGNRQWHLLKRISDAPFDYIPQVSVVRYDGIPPNFELEYVAKITATEDNCVAACLETIECVASVYSTLTEEMNCFLANETFDPINISLSARKNWQTYVVANDFRDMKFTSLNGTEYIWKSNSHYSEKPIKTYNETFETECAAVCASTPVCTAFKFTNYELFSNGNCEIHNQWHHIKPGNVSVFIRLSFPYQENGTKFSRHRYHYDMNDTIVMRKGKTFKQCERLCASFAECTSFVFVDPPINDFEFNCIPKKNRTGYSGHGKLTRLLLDGLNTFIYANDTIQKSVEYDYYSVHSGNCFDPSLPGIKSSTVAQHECRLMCDELPQCMAFVVKYEYTTYEDSCTLSYNKCDYVDQSDEPRIYSFQTMIKQGPLEAQFMFGQTNYIRWFGDCHSTDYILSINVSSIDECAAHCAQFSRCEYFSYIFGPHQPNVNCVVGKQFCFQPEKRIHRGDTNWQLFQRISHEQFDYIENRVATRFSGVCVFGDNELSTWTVKTVSDAYECGLRCVALDDCSAYSYMHLSSDVISKYNIPNCALGSKMCDPTNLRRSENTGYETYQIIADFSGANRFRIRETEFLNETRGIYSGDMLQSYNTSNMHKCAEICLGISECAAFSFSSGNRSDFNCETFFNLSLNGVGATAKFVKLSFLIKVNNSLLFTRYNYDCGVTMSHSTETDLVACANLCIKTDKCVAFVYTHDDKKFVDSFANCVLKLTVCTTNDTVLHVLLPDWNTYVFTSWPVSPAETYIHLHNNDSSFTGDLYKLHDCARSCDDKPSCTGFTSNCEHLYCQPTTDRECLSKLNGSVFMKNNTGAHIITWSYREYSYSHSYCLGGFIKISQKTNVEMCLSECWYDNACVVVVYKSDESPNCYLHNSLCQTISVDNGDWHMYNQVSFGLRSYNGQLFRAYNGECPTATELESFISKDKQKCGQECAGDTLCQAFVLTVDGYEYNCSLRDSFCPIEKLIHMGENSNEQFLRYKVDILGLQLNKIIQDRDGNHFNKYALTEEDCHKKCESEQHCLAMSYRWDGVETDEFCQLHDELVFQSETSLVQSDNNWNVWITQILLFGFAKQRALCKHYADKLPDYSLMQCARHCARMLNCRDIAIVDSECWINTKTCSLDVQSHYNGEAYNKVLYKESGYRKFDKGEFAVSYKLCSDRHFIESVDSEIECAKRCIALNENCSSFVWYPNSSNACSIQTESCVSGNETRGNLTIYRKLSLVIKGLKLTTNEKGSLTKFEYNFEDDLTALVLVITVPLIVAGGLIALIIIIVRRKFKKLKELVYLDRDLNNHSKEIDPILPVFEQLENLKLDKKFELPLDSIDVDRKTLKTLGMGNFGRVVLGNYKMPDGKSVSVAIKRTRSSWDAEQYRMLFKEICLMANIGKHPNLVNLVGAVTQIAKGHLYLVMDYCSNGSLRQFIIKSVEENQFHNEIVSNGNEESYAIKLDGNSQLCTSDLLSFAFQIASGMEYVASVKLVHRDLAARNVLLTSDLIAKISDFGLGRQEYQFYETDKTVLLPIRWTSPEALLLHKFSTRSDVWSFGVTLGEIFSLGTVPFANVSKFDRTFAEDLKEGRLIVPKPQFSPERVYKLITHCCMPDPKNRVSFAQCKNLLLDEFRFCNAAKFEQLIERLLVIQKSFPNEDNSEMSTDPATSATESPSKRQNFFGRFLAQKPSPSQKGLEDLMLKEFKRETVELNTYQ